MTSLWFGQPCSVDSIGPGYWLATILLIFDVYWSTRSYSEDSIRVATPVTIIEVPRGTTVIQEEVIEAK